MGRARKNVSAPEYAARIYVFDFGYSNHNLTEFLLRKDLGGVQKNVEKIVYTDIDLRKYKLFKAELPNSKYKKYVINGYATDLNREDADLSKACIKFEYPGARFVGKGLLAIVEVNYNIYKAIWQYSSETWECYFKKLGPGQGKVLEKCGPVSLWVSDEPYLYIGSCPNGFPEEEQTGDEEETTIIKIYKDMNVPRSWEYIVPIVPGWQVSINGELYEIKSVKDYNNTIKIEISKVSAAIQVEKIVGVAEP